MAAAAAAAAAAPAAARPPALEDDLEWTQEQKQLASGTHNMIGTLKHVVKACMSYARVLLIKKIWLLIVELGIQRKDGRRMLGISEKTYDRYQMAVESHFLQVRVSRLYIPVDQHC
jgi:hypothetical protein